MRKLLKLIRRPFCKHKLMPYMWYLDNKGNGHMWKKTVWKCIVCGKERG